MSDLYRATVDRIWRLAEDSARWFYERAGRHVASSPEAAEDVCADAIGAFPACRDEIVSCYLKAFDRKMAQLVREGCVSQWDDAKPANLHPWSMPVDVQAGAQPLTLDELLAEIKNRRLEVGLMWDAYRQTFGPDQNNPLYGNLACLDFLLGWIEARQKLSAGEKPS